ncbi:MAG: hypothetical protein M3066_15165 [Actinomycetota bacterium]|nr:hypothetical protein [Actinomycetota bacterium]
MRVLGRSAEWAELGFTPVAVGFSPPEALAALADDLDWPFLFGSDEDRRLYHRLGLGSAPIRELFTKGTRAIYAKARADGRPLPLPVEDPRQLGGDAVVVAGETRMIFRPTSPDDRPDVDELLRAAAATRETA